MGSLPAEINEEYMSVMSQVLYESQLFLILTLEEIFLALMFYCPLVIVD